MVPFGTTLPFVVVKSSLAKVVAVYLNRYRLLDIANGREKVILDILRLEFDSLFRVRRAYSVF